LSARRGATATPLPKGNAGQGGGGWIRDEAASAGRFESKLWQKDYPKIQIVTIEGLLAGTERIDAPSQINPFAMAARESSAHQQTEML